MNHQCKILLIALGLVSFLLFQQWNSNEKEITYNEHETIEPNEIIPKSFINSSLSTITATTDVLTLNITTIGGDIIEAKLNKYLLELGSSTPFALLKNTPKHQFIAQSGLIGPNGIDLTKDNRPHYKTNSNHFQLTEGLNELRIPLTYQENGIYYTKTFILKRNSYALDIEFQIMNRSGKNATVGMYSHLRQNMMDSGGSITLPTYQGGAYSTQDTRYKKYSFDNMKERNLSLNIFHDQGWAAMIQHYFAAAWIPRNNSTSTLYTRIIDDLADIGIRFPNVTIKNGDSAKFKSTLWIGPKLQDEMELIAPNLDLVVDYGWLWFIAKPLHKLLSFIQRFASNWGVSIIILTFIIRGAMYSLTKAQYTSMAKMRVLQPKLQAMKERIGNDRQRMSQEMMELYRKEKVSPLGGCLPILLQMPIFIALYWTLMESVELRHSPFIGWIHDLSAPDPYFILPILMGISMFLIQKMSPTTITDPLQQKIMTFIPVIFTGFLLWFPSGLVLYWLISNIVTVIQQTLIYKTLAKKGLY
ncbi:inner membrane protein oxaA [Candidatus Photodesmus katoptron]|uniref:membrane protein insertase YidC n=1 Tax=Candidatus Photodesmus anomalopis TaxID=28176 RepID=UPI0004D95744|nr:membrane protein insertase YidC [Candidatus Photodesmus katoptron]KEY90208.1 inner membrane protein oxaA [Candidatus Photodesmus katoptron]